MKRDLFFLLLGLLIGFIAGLAFYPYKAGARDAEGKLTALDPATVAGGGCPMFLVVSPDGESVYVTNHCETPGVSQYSRGSGGKLTPLDPAGVEAGTEPCGIAISPDSKFVYVANSGSESVSQYARGSGGKLTPLEPAEVEAGKTPYGIVVDLDSVYVTNEGEHVV